MAAESEVDHSHLKPHAQKQIPSQRWLIGLVLQCRRGTSDEWEVIDQIGKPALGLALSSWIPYTSAGHHFASEQ